MTWPDQGATAAGGNGESLGQRAERSVHERLRAALSADYVLLQNVSWVVRSHGGFVREGEADPQQVGPFRRPVA